MRHGRLYDAERYEILAAAYAKEYTAITNDNVGAYRTKVVRAGNYLYVSCYPLLDTRPSTAAECEMVNVKGGVFQNRKARAQYAKYNNARRARTFEQLVHANFDAGDYHITCTYEQEDYDRLGACDRRDRERAKRDVTNYIERVKRRIMRHGCDLSEFRWIVCTVTKESRYETNPFPDRHHHHILMHGAPEELRGEIERLWRFGYCNADRLQPNHEGLAAMAGYIARQEGSANGERAREKSYRTSRNIKRPTVLVSDKKISRRRVAQIAADVRANANEIFDKVWPGYGLVEQPKIMVSDFVAGAYIWAKLRARRDVNARAAAEAERVWDQRRAIHGT